MTNKLVTKQIRNIIKGSSPEAKEMQGIMLRMIDGEMASIKANSHLEVCPQCGRSNK